MADAPLEVRLQVTNPSQFAEGRTDIPVAERKDPTKVRIYTNGDGIDVVLDSSIASKQRIVTIPSGTGTGAKMGMWTSQQMTEEAIAYAAAQVKLLAKGAPVNVSCPEQYKAAFEAAYSKP